MVQLFTCTHFPYVLVFAPVYVCVCVCVCVCVFVFYLCIYLCIHTCVNLCMLVHAGLPTVPYLTRQSRFLVIVPFVPYRVQEV